MHLGIEIGKRDNCLFIKPNHLSVKMVQTNDVVELTNKNKFLLIGRKDFIINSGGVKLNPRRQLIDFFNPLLNIKPALRPIELIKKRLSDLETINLDSKLDIKLFYS